MTKRRDEQHEEELDELLAAPDSVLQNEIETRKYRQRKEREASREARLRASKSPDPPTVEDLLADLIRVAEDEHLNPWHETRTLSRRRYEIYGRFPMEVLDAEFGQFNHALEVAGLRDQPGDRLWRAKRAKESRREHAERYLERHVLPYVASRDDFRELHAPYDLVSISDTHSQFMCPFVWFAFLSFIRDAKPDGVLLNGDILDATEISRHPKIPGWSEPLQSELDFKREMFRQIREDAGHAGDLFDTGGNHDTADRLTMYVTQVAKGLASLRSLRVDELLGLADFDVQLFHGGTIMSPSGTEDEKPGFLLFDSYRIHHGTCLGQHPAASELKAAGRSGQSGHVHRAQIHYGTTERDEGLSWMCTPAGCRHEAARAYIKGTNTGWQRGFGFARIYPDGTVHQYPVVVSGSPDRVSVEGFIYERPADMDDPPCHGQWLSEMRLR